MATTDTRRELERFQATTAKRRTRSRVLAAVAAAAVVTAGIYAGTTIGSGAGHRGDQITHIVPAPTGITQATLPTVPQRVPASKVTALGHVGFVETFAFGSLWTTDTHRLYRVTPDGRHIESTIAYHPATGRGLNGDPVPPFAVGTSLLVPVNAAGRDAYLILDPQGHEHGELQVPAAGPGHADATGAWAVTGESSLSRLSPDGRRITRTLTLPGTQLVGVDEGGGYVWALDNYSSAVLKVDPDTGKVVGRSPTNNDPVNGMLYADNAVYLTTEAFDLRRIDPTTMQLTAQESGTRDNQWGWQFLAAGPDGSLWTDVGDTAIAQLNPRNLHPLSFTTITTDNLGYHNGGTGIIAVTASKVYLAGTSHPNVYTIDR